MNFRATLVALVCALGCGDAAGARDGGADVSMFDVSMFDAAVDMSVSDAALRDSGDASSADVPMETATRLLHWNDGLDVRVVPPESSSDTGSLRGGDFARAIWAADESWSWATWHHTPDGLAEDFAEVTLPDLPSRDNVFGPTLKMARRANAASTSLSLIERQSPGRAGDVDATFPGHTLVEPVFYQRQWIKFSPDTRGRAGIAGEDFAQVFWEMRAEPDYRLRVELNYDDNIGLVVRAHDDSLVNEDAVHIDSGLVPVGTIEMANEDVAFGWHPVEIWLDRTRGDESRWRVRFSGFDVVDYTGPLLGESGNVINIAAFAQLQADATTPATSSFYQLIEDIELWDSPPGDSFR